jgi:Ca-activated chloride channel family protein
MMAQTQIATDAHPSSGGRLVALDGRPLPLEAVSLRAEASGGLARVVLEQRFRNPYPDPLVVAYSVPLPADGAISGYAFQIGERRLEGEVDRRSCARERFEEALLEGRGAALLEQERSSLFSQEIGNIPPDAEVTAEIAIDQKLRWLAEGQWEWRFPTVVAPRYLGADGRVPDAERVRMDVCEEPLPVRMHFSLDVSDPLAEGGEPRSPSHPIVAAPAASGARVSLRDEAGAALDRDLVVRWPVAKPEVGVSLRTARPPAAGARSRSAYGLLSLVPPSPDASGEALARDLIVLLDTSGSMHGEPLEQARQIVAALVESLTEEDQLEMIAFSSQTERWKRRPRRVSRHARAEALEWLAKRAAGGGTEMHSGIREALKPVRRDSQRQIVLVSDGLIGFESEIVTLLCERLPRTSRLHTVGVGPAVNRSLTAAAARAGRGEEILVGLGEDPGQAAARLVAHTRAPILVDLEITGSALRAHAPVCLPDVFAAAPARIALELDPGGGVVQVRGATQAGRFERSITLPPLAAGEGSSGVVASFARESVEDLEMRRAASGYEGDALDPEIETLGLEFQIATRLTSWVAVSQETLVDPKEPTRRVRIPQAVPQGLSVEGLGLRECAGPMPPMMGRARAYAAFEELAAAPLQADVSPPPAPPGARRRLGRRRGRESRSPERDVPVSGAAPLRGAELGGRIVRQREHELVVEFELDADIDWSVPRQVILHLPGGETCEVDVDPERTTRSGELVAGQVVRLWLRLAAPLSASPDRVSFEELPMSIAIEP